MSNEKDTMQALKQHVLSVVQQDIAMASKPLRSITIDDFQNILIDAMESAASDGIIPEHLKLLSGLELFNDDEFFDQVRALFP